MPSESYFYDDNVGTSRSRVKKIVGGVATYNINGFYEVSGSTVMKYYYFNSQRIAMRKGDTLTYLHGDRGLFGRGSTVLETSSNNAITADQKCYAYGRQRNTGLGHLFRRI